MWDIVRLSGRPLCIHHPDHDEKRCMNNIFSQSSLENEEMNVGNDR